MLFHKAVFRHSVRGHLKSALALYGVLAAVLIFMTVLYIKNAAALGRVTIGGLGMASAIMLLVLGTEVPAESLRLYTANGISRKTQFVTKLCATLLFVLCIAILENTLAWALHAALPYRSLFMQAEPGSLSEKLAFSPAVYVSGIAWSFSVLLLSFSTGFFCAAIVKLLPQRIRPWSVAGLVILLVNGSGWLAAQAGFFRQLYGNTATQHALVHLLGAALLLGAGFLAFRRIQLTAERK